MGLVVLPASIPDIRKVYDVYFAAFEDSFITKVLFPWDVKDEEFRKGHTALTLDYWHKDNIQYTCKCIDTNTDEIVGMGLWDVHWQERSDGAQKPAVDWLQGEQKQRAEDLIVPLWEAKEELLGPSKHVCEYCPAFRVLRTDEYRLPRHCRSAQVPGQGYRHNVDTMGS
jgi:hypothetical protein